MLQCFIKSKDNSAKNVLPSNFAEQLKDQAALLADRKLPAKISLKVAMMQANPMIAHLLITGPAELIILMDSDFAMYAGQQSLCMKEYYYNHRESSLSKIRLLTGDQQMATEIVQYLSSFLPARKFKTPKFPLFSGEPDPMFRALISVGLGCDVHPGGIKGLGPSTLYSIVQNISGMSQSTEERCDRLATELTKAAMLLSNDTSCGDKQMKEALVVLA